MGGTVAGRRSVVLDLPFPPSVNTYWRHVGPKVLISKPGRIFREEVWHAVRTQVSSKNMQLSGRLHVDIELFPPDKRKRDLDNFGGKALLDALQAAGLYIDDEQIDALTIVRGEIRKGGGCRVEVREL